MALFSKPPAKKPAPPPPARPGVRRAVSARDVAAQAADKHKPRPGAPAGEPADISVTGVSIIDWSSSQPAIEVAQANPGLCTVLENAALMYASGQAPAARSLLEEGVVSDEDARLSALAWLALFDLLKRSDDRAAFEQLALQFVVQFERSPPAWEEQAAMTSLPAPKANAGGYVAITGTLSGDGFGPLEGLRKAIEKRVPQARVDVSQVTGFDDRGAIMLADLLGLARKAQLELVLQRPEKLLAMLEAAVARGREGGEGAWLLSLELMQWQHEHARFDDRAVEFAIAFELSPPSWEPPPRPAQAESAPGSVQGANLAPDSAAGGHPPRRASDVAPMVDAQVLAWSGVLTGASPRHLHELAEFAAGRPVMTLDLTDVERIDFVCAGALLNAINRIESQRKAVQIAGATPIIRALLLLIGISPRHFIRKT